MSRRCLSVGIIAAAFAAALTFATRDARAAEVPPGAAKDGWEIAVGPDHVDGVYRGGETITFTVTLRRDGAPATEGNLAYEIKVGGTRKLDAGTVAVKRGVAKVTTQLGEPGCLQIMVRYSIDENTKVRAETGAAVDPEKLRPALPPPDDFDAFWAAQKERLADTPMNAKLTPVEVPGVPWNADVECFDVQLDCPGGAPVSGYFARPKGASAKSCPAWISFHGAGAHSAYLLSTAGRAKHRGMLGMDAGAHGLPNGKPKDYYAALLSGDLKSYSTRGMESRDTYYMLGMYLRVARAVDFLASQPEWDGRMLIASGSSQGGAQALVAAGLDSRVSIVSASLPALCDLTASVADRGAGWPIGLRKLTDAERETLRYFDVCHFAARTRAKAVIRIGLVDHTCWPTGVLAMSSQLQGTKYLLITPNSGHGWTPPSAYAAASKKLDELLAAARRPPDSPSGAAKP